MTDALADIRGESLVDEPLVDEPAPATTFLDAAVAVFSAPFNAAAAVITGAQDTAASIAGSGAGVITGAQNTAASVAGSLASVATPTNLFGYGAGIATGGLVTGTVLGVVGAFAADQLFFSGSGTRYLAHRVFG